MKKLFGFILTTVLILGIFPPITNAAKNDLAFCKQYAGVKKIWWDGMELKSGQIGRLMVQKDTELFKLNGDTKTFSRTLKKGEFYRIYAFKPGMLSVGGGYYVNRDSKVTYETPSKAKLQAVQCITNPYGTQANPTKIGDTWVIEQKEDRLFDGKKKYEITLVETITDGDLVWKMIDAKEYWYNEPAPEGKKYILAKFNVKLLEKPDEEIWDVANSYFNHYRKNGSIYNDNINVYYGGLGSIFEGESVEGWIAFTVDENDDPLITWNRGIAEETVWFKTK